LAASGLQAYSPAIRAVRNSPPGSRHGFTQPEGSVRSTGADGTGRNVPGVHRRSPSIGEPTLPGAAVGGSGAGVHRPGPGGGGSSAGIGGSSAGTTPVGPREAEDPRTTIQPPNRAGVRPLDPPVHPVPSQAPSGQHGGEGGRELPHEPRGTQARQRFDPEPGPQRSAVSV